MTLYGNSLVLDGGMEAQDISFAAALYQNITRPIALKVGDALPTSEVDPIPMRFLGEQD